MKLFIFGLLLLLSVSIAKSKEIHEETQDIFRASSSEVPKPQERYATKEVIMYLTPSQIKALHSGEAYITSHPIAQLGAENQGLQQQYMFNLRNHNNPVNLEMGHLQTIQHTGEVPKGNPLEYLDTTKSIEQSPKEEQQVYINTHFLQKPEQKQLFFPGLDKEKELRPSLPKQEKKIESKQTPWIPINPLSYINPENLFLTHILRNQLNPTLDNNHVNIEGLPVLPVHLVPVDQLKYSQNNAILKNIHSVPKLNNPNEVEKQKALAEIVAIANSLPVRTHSDSKISFRKHLSESTPAYKHLIIPLPLLFKNTKILHANQPTIPNSSQPFFYSSLDLEKLEH